MLCPQLFSSEDKWPQRLCWYKDASVCACLDSVCAELQVTTETGGQT